jgi:translation initiation factor 1
MMKKNSRLVYSTETGRVQEDGNPSKNSSYTDGVIRVHRETKGRKGNGVSLIKGFDLDEKSLKTLAKTLKQKMGVGGSVKNGVIEIQSDQRDQLKALLDSMGHSVKLAGS